MTYTEQELKKKVKEEILSLYEGLIGTIWERLNQEVGEGKAKRFFNKEARDLGLFFIKDGQINLKGFLQDKEKDEIVSWCNSFISSLIVKIRNKG